MAPIHYLSHCQPRSMTLYEVSATFTHLQIKSILGYHFHVKIILLWSLNEIADFFFFSNDSKTY